MAVHIASEDRKLDANGDDRDFEAGRRGARRVVVCFPFEGGPVGGSHVSALRLIQLLDRDRFEPLVILHSPVGAVAELFLDEGIEPELAPVRTVFTPGGWPRPGGLLRGGRDIWRMSRFLRERRVAIVHTNEGPMHATWTLPARLAGARHIWHHRGNPRAAGLRLLAPLTATRVLSVSNFAAPAPGLFSARRKCAVVYSPFNTDMAVIDRNKARADARASLGIGGETRLIAFIAQFAERKRPLVFVDTIAALLRDYPAQPLIGLMFGQEFEPGQQHLIEQRVRALGVESSIRLMGFRRPIEPWLAAADALVVPAVEEPFGRTLIEAMLLGVPVVAAATGGNLEAIEHGRTGLLARVDDPADFARHVSRLLAEPMLAETITAHARQKAIRQFGAENHACRVAEIYQEALAA